MDIHELQAHVEACPTCQAAYDPKLHSHRVNDLCPNGKILFFEWAKDKRPGRTEILSKEESEPIIARERKRAQKANLN